MTTPQQARELLEELTSFVVLDPACGCGNFLDIAYRELRGLEHQLKQRITDLAASTGQTGPPDLTETGVEVAELTEPVKWLVTNAACRGRGCSLTLEQVRTIG